MVHVGVGRHDEIQAPDPQRRQRRHHRMAAQVEPAGQGDAGIHQDRGLAALHDDRVAVAHVEQRGPFGAMP